MASLSCLADLVKDTFSLHVIWVKHLLQLEARYDQTVLRLLVLGAVELSVLDSCHEGRRLVAIL